MSRILVGKSRDLISDQSTGYSIKKSSNISYDHHVKNNFSLIKDVVSRQEMNEMFDGEE